MDTFRISSDESCLSADEPISCPRCGADLSLHQPDLDQPQRLLATCPECRSWYLVDAKACALICVDSDETGDE
jgi:hypothetical protein